MLNGLVAVVCCPVQEEMELAAAELEAVQSRLLSLEAEKNTLAAKLEANRQEAAASSEVGAGWMVNR